MDAGASGAVAFAAAARLVALGARPRRSARPPDHRARRPRVHPPRRRAARHVTHRPGSRRAAGRAARRQGVHAPSGASGRTGGTIPTGRRLRPGAGRAQLLVLGRAALAVRTRQTLDGYWALAACAARAIERASRILGRRLPGRPSTRPPRASCFAGEAEIPMLDERIANLREVGRGLLGSVGGSFASDRGERRRQRRGPRRRRRAPLPLVRRRRRPTTASEVRFYKRAQILVSDLHGVFRGEGSGASTTWIG